MVDVTSKPVSARRAVAESIVKMEPETLRMIRDRQFNKGDVLAVAQLAAIQATKHTAVLIPLCHPLPVEAVSAEFTLLPPDRVRLVVSVQTTARTGVEMEAMVAASVGALTVYDMCKSSDRGMQIESIRLLLKDGGKSGHWQASP